MKYRVNDIYTCVQGEGCQTGLAMVMLRLQGCSVGCPWCDTKETWSLDGSALFPTIEAVLGANPRYAVVEADLVARYITIKHAGPRWVLISGGEPADQHLAPLVEALHDEGYKVAIETSGTASGVLGAGIDWVCVSPKIGMPGGRVVLREVVDIADEIKHVVGKQDDITKLDMLLEHCSPKASAEVCLQPLSTSDKATQLCIDTVQRRGWRLSIQTHKYLRLP